MKDESNACDIFKQFINLSRTSSMFHFTLFSQTEGKNNSQMSQINIFPRSLYAYTPQGNGV